MEKGQTNKIISEDINSNKSMSDNNQISNIARICENAKRIIDKNEQILYESQQKIKLISINPSEKKIDSFDAVESELKELNMNINYLKKKINCLEKQYNLDKNKSNDDGN
jgi:hypothetical protein